MAWLVLTVIPYTLAIILVAVLRLDRIYVRGFAVDKAEVHYGQPWSRISDHAALTAQLRPR